MDGDRGDPQDERGQPEEGAGRDDRVDPEDERFEQWVAEAIDALPAAFRERLGSVAIIVEEWPAPAQLASLHVAGLYGLYVGVPRSALGADYAATPSRITIYRGTIRRHFPTADGQRAKVFDTVHHEIAHHFGISDARLRELQGLAPDNRHN